MPRVFNLHIMLIFAYHLNCLWYDLKNINNDWSYQGIKCFCNKYTFSVLLLLI